MKRAFYLNRRIVTALAVFLSMLATAVSPAIGHAGWSLELPSSSSTTLDNGLRVISVQYRPHLPIVRVDLIVDAGAVDDPPGKEGLAELTGALAGKGTSARTSAEIEGFFEFAGGAYLPTVSMTSSSFVFAVLKKDLDMGLEILADLILNPVFPEEEILFLRHQSAAALQAQLDDPGSLVTLHLNRLLYGGDHRAGRRVSEASLSAITREDIVAFHRDYYTPQNAVLIFTGSISSEEAFAAAEKWFGHWPAKERPPVVLPEAPVRTWDGSAVRLVERPGMTEMHIAMAFPAVDKSDPRLAALHLAEYSLSGEWVSRLFRSLRGESGLVYFVSSDLSAWTFPGRLMIHTASGNETWEKAFRILVDELSRFRDGITPEELEQAKMHAVGSFPLSISTIAGVAGLIADDALSGSELGESLGFVDRVNAITLDEVNDALRDVIDFDKMALVLMGDPAMLDFAEEVLEELLSELSISASVERVDWLSVDP